MEGWDYTGWEVEGHKNWQQSSNPMQRPENEGSQSCESQSEWKPKNLACDVWGQELSEPAQAKTTNLLFLQLLFYSDPQQIWMMPKQINEVDLKKNYYWNYNIGPHFIPLNLFQPTPISPPSHSNLPLCQKHFHRTDIARNNVLQAIWSSLRPVRLIHKVNHHRCIIHFTKRLNCL